MLNVTHCDADCEGGLEVWGDGNGDGRAFMTVSDAVGK